MSAAAGCCAPSAERTRRDDRGLTAADMARQGGHQAVLQALQAG
jgi:hypothetical protein